MLQFLRSYAPFRPRLLADFALEIYQSSSLTKPSDCTLSLLESCFQSVLKKAQSSLRTELDKKIGCSRYRMLFFIWRCFFFHRLINMF
jgi:hypothetical protein